METCTGCPPYTAAPLALKHDREITLGERRSWARSRDRDVLTRLRGPDPGDWKFG